jgi:hypothetical protein
VVDDMPVTYDDPALTASIAEKILTAFPGKPQGKVSYYNGMKLTVIMNMMSFITA